MTSVAWPLLSVVPQEILFRAFFLSRYGPLPAESVRALAAGLAEALAAVHATGLVHRDLKPSNVLLASDGPRLIDFGISRAADTTTLTDTGQSIGSPGYLSPEQAVGHEVGPPGDIFSLGAVLAFAASGRGPFGIGSPLHAFICGLHGVYPARWVSVPSTMAIRRIVKTAIGRRRQLFSPSPERNGSKTRNPMATTGPMRRAGVSMEGGK